MEMKRWHGALLALLLAGFALAMSACDDNNATNSTGAVSQTAVTVSPVSGPTATMFGLSLRRQRAEESGREARHRQREGPASRVSSNAARRPFASASVVPVPQ